MTSWTGDRGRARRLLGTTALSLCALCWCGAIYADDIHLFFVLVSGAAFLNDLTMGAAWATCQDLGRRHAAVTAAAMNTVGTIGAALAGWLTGEMVQAAQRAQAAALELSVEQMTDAARMAGSMIGYRQVFISYAAVYAVAALCWLAVDPSRPIDES